MKQRKSLELYPLTMCYFIKRTQKCTKLFFNHYFMYFMKRFFLFILILMAFVSCGEEEKSTTVDKCKDVICSEWENCNVDNGMCELTDGRCSTNDDCKENKV